MAFLKEVLVSLVKNPIATAFMVAGFWAMAHEAWFAPIPDWPPTPLFLLGTASVMLGLGLYLWTIIRPRP